VENNSDKFLKPTGAKPQCVTMGTAIENLTIKEEDKSNKGTIYDNTNIHFAPSLPNSEKGREN
jgi:hypothetical protein